MSDPSRNQPAQRIAAWPEDHPFSGAGYERVDCTVSCVLTRFRLPSVWSLLRFYLTFRRVRRDARRVGGLLQSVFLLEGPRSCCTLSLWSDDQALVEFGTRVTSHIDAAGHFFAASIDKKRQRPEIWSTQWRLWALSENLNWDDFDLRAALADQLGRPAHEIAQGRLRKAAP